VQKVCTHFAVLRRGKLVQCGPVDDVGKGEETVEVMAYHDDFSIYLQEFAGIASIKREEGVYQVMMKDGFHSQDLNKYLFDKGIVVSHLVTKRKSLEKQFLEILSDANH
ncbi:MAG: ABC transporter ATP-binding protein, partial [Cytophagales bacterium]